MNELITVSRPLSIDGSRWPSRVVLSLQAFWQVVCAQLTNYALSMRFVMGSTLVLCATMLHIGAWIDARVKDSVKQSAAMTLSNYVRRAIATQVAELSSKGLLSDGSRRALSTLIGHGATDHGILEFKLWQANGTLAFASRQTPSRSHARHATDIDVAFHGQIVSHFEEDYDFELGDAVAGVPIFNVYTPLYADPTGPVIAVAEFYQDAASLSRELTIARQHNWLVAGSLTAGALVLLFGIVHRGSIVILAQQQSLKEEIVVQARLLRQNERLQLKLTRAHQNSHLVSDHLLRRVGADLHDGPAQLLALALMRLHELQPPRDEASGTSPALEAVQSATQDALAEIRSISTGLSLPQLDKLTTRQTLLSAVTAHERRTMSNVSVHIGDIPEDLPLAYRTCLYRGVQEGLNNAFRHASGKGQALQVHTDADAIKVAVEDTGPGFSPTLSTFVGGSLGPTGLGHRVESLGGSLSLVSHLGKGTIVLISLPIVSGEA